MVRTAEAGVKRLQLFSAGGPSAGWALQEPPEQGR